MEFFLKPIIKLIQSNHKLYPNVVPAYNTCNNNNNNNNNKNNNKNNNNKWRLLKTH